MYYFTMKFIFVHGSYTVHVSTDPVYYGERLPTLFSFFLLLFSPQLCPRSLPLERRQTFSILHLPTGEPETGRLLREPKSPLLPLFLQNNFYCRKPHVHTLTTHVCVNCHVGETRNRPPLLRTYVSLHSPETFTVDLYDETTHSSCSCSIP